MSRLPIFGPPTLLKGEDAAAYDGLLARVSGAVKPSDIFEEIGEREIVDLIWESWRWRRCLTNLLASATEKRLGCKRRSNNPSLKRPGMPVAPE